MKEMAEESISLSRKLSELSNSFGRNVQSATSANGKTPSAISEHFQTKKSAGVPSTVASKVPVIKSNAACRSSSSYQQQMELERLRDFDLTAAYGPCTGISRMERWRRAEAFGFRPPVDVRGLISKHAADPRYTESVWYAEKI